MKPLVLIASLLAFSTPALSQNVHMSMPREPGQAAFAAVAEIVDGLRADDGTNWEEVDITALRDHLVDMDLVTMRAEVTTDRHDTGATFDVRGTDDSIAAIQRMTTAHAPKLMAETGWRVSVRKTPNGAEMTVTSTDARDAAQISALGFFGVMTVGAHHQMHHLAIARGANPHHP
jgi:hypothetical protein